MDKSSSPVYSVAKNEEWNGASWSKKVGDLNTARIQVMLEQEQQLQRWLWVDQVQTTDLVKAIKNGVEVQIQLKQ